MHTKDDKLESPTTVYAYFLHQVRPLDATSRTSCHLCGARWASAAYSLGNKYKQYPIPLCSRCYRNVEFDEDDRKRTWLLARRRCEQLMEGGKETERP